tara:strand:+ start:71 stop:1033 length:963 start_codon:yes stop_codon:yes gene_type:complete
MDLHHFNKNSTNPLAKNQKVKLFIIFFLISFLFWGVTKFSKNYSALVLFDVKYINVPSLLILEPKYKIIEGYVNTSGFQLFFYRFFRKTLKVDFSVAELENSKGLISLVSLRRSLDDQIIGSFLSFENEKLFFDYSVHITKKVAVKIDDNSKFNIASGFSLINDPLIEPDSIDVSGPKSKLDKLNSIPILINTKEEISANIESVVFLKNNDPFIRFNPDKVLYKQSIKKFTEQSFDVFLKVINIPDSLKIKLFPRKVKLFSSFPIEFVNNVRNDDFELIFDYLDTNDGNFQSVPIRLNKSPNFSKNVRWEPKSISYLIKK